MTGQFNPFSATPFRYTLNLRQLSEDERVRNSNLMSDLLATAGGVWSGMELLESQLQNLASIVGRIREFPTVDEMCSHLAQRVCPSGEIARVWVGHADPDQMIRTVAHFGYSIKLDVSAIARPLDGVTPMPTSVRENRIILANIDELLQKFPQYVPFDDHSPWKSSAFVPTGTRYVYVFHLQTEIKYLLAAEAYFRCLSELLRFYHELVSERSLRVVRDENVAASSRPELIRGTPLTDRQNQILKMIKDGLTNGAIALRIGYSESLVRRETIIIYAKLGIRGRKDLQIQIEESSPSYRR